MATFSKEILSGSVDGKFINVGAGSAGGGSTIIHTASSTATTIDELWVYANNVDPADVKLSIQWGAYSSGATNLMEMTIPAEGGLVLVIPGLVLKGNASTALFAAAFAATTSVIQLSGYVNRITA